jgi:hypothetical protein
MLSKVTSTKGKWVLVWLRFSERYKEQWGIACWDIWYRGEIGLEKLRGTAASKEHWREAYRKQ